MEEGKIDRERAARFAAEFDRLRASYAKSMGEIAADDLATREAMDALEWQAMTDRRQKMMQIRTQQDLLGKLQQHLDKGGKAKHFAIAVMDHHEAMPGLPSVENTRGAIEMLTWSRMDNFLKEHGRNLLGKITNEEDLQDVVRALRGEHVDNPLAMQTAASVADALEFLRQQFNAAGGAIPKLDNWGLPQSHDALEIANAGYEAWRDFILPKLDWQRMVDTATNKPFAGEDALEPALQQAWKNITSNGLDNATPGAVNGVGKLANRHADHRFFIFKSADDWLEYNDRFGVGSAFDAITGHIGSMSRDIAAMRVLGPNPDATVRWMRDMLRKDAMPTIEGGRQVKLEGDAGRGAKLLGDLWDYYSGELTRVAPENRAMARRFAFVRNWNVMSKLGSAYISAQATDPMFMGITAKFNGLPVMDQVGTYLRTFNPADSSHRDAALHAGLVFSEMTGRAERMYRDGKFNFHEASRRGATGVLQSTLLTPHTVAAKQSVGLGFMKDWAEHAGESFAELAEPNRLAFERYGISADDWDRLREVGPVEQEGGLLLLRPADLARTQEPGALDAAVKFMSLVDSETKFSVPGESLRAQTAVATFLGRAERGTFGGELKHSMMQFKTYSVIWMMTHLERALYGRGGMGRLQYALTLPLFLTLGGYIADTLIDISRGENPSMVPDGQRVARAFARGGGAGVLGDMVSAAATGDRANANPISGYLVGPTIGAIADPVAALTFGNLGEAASGKDAHLSSELVKQARQALPGSNIWYLRAAVNRLALDQLQELADPNYRQSWRRMVRAAAERGSSYWWAPGDALPAGAPTISTSTTQGAPQP
ncbi:hypothetical protein [Novosphingobium sp.]|uniref:hypothetical protein n=1 Tax=Novosphingobium sp. TaxID=1874826 RepID=UPI0038BBDFB5